MIFIATPFTQEHDLLILRATSFGRCIESQSPQGIVPQRFPDTEPMFGFGDFSLFLIAPEAGRLVGGFAQARSLRGEEVLEALAATA